MRIRMYIAAFYGAAAVAASGFVEAMTMRAYDETIGGQLEILSDEGTLSAEVLVTDFDVSIRDNIAEVQLRQVFAPMGDAGDATYLLPVSPLTELVAMEISQGTKVQRKALTATEAVLPDPKTFSQDLNLAGALPVEITMIYRLPVHVDGTFHSITLPTAVAPGGWTEFKPVDFEFEDMPEYLCGEKVLSEALDRERIDIAIVIEGTEFSEIYSDSHEVDITAIEGGRFVELATAEYVANHAFTLTFVPNETGMTQVANVERTR